MSNTVFRARAPLRLGLAGGGTDVSPYCDEFGGAIINVTIDRYAYASIRLRADNKVVFHAVDQGIEEEFPIDRIVPDDSTLKLHRGIFNRIYRSYGYGRCSGFTLTTHVDAPMGSGLGSSSALVVAMLAVMREYMHLPLGEYELARLAFDIERVDLGLKGGRQDQYAATFGGFNFMEFHANERVIVNPLRMRPRITNEIESSLLLTYSGVSRESAKIIDNQSNTVKSGGKSLEAMHQLKEEAVQMKEALLFGNVCKIGEILRSGWEAKKMTSPSVSTPEVEQLFDVAMKNGAIAGKLSGAGGGGFALFLVDPDIRPLLRRAIDEQTNASPTFCKITNFGVDSWSI